MRKGIFKRLSEVFTTRTKSWLRRLCLRDTPLTITREKKRSWIFNRKKWAVTSSFRKELQTNMSREVTIKLRRWKAWRKKSWFLKNHFNKSFTILRKRKNSWSSSMSRSLKNRKKISLIFKKTLEVKTRSSRMWEHLPKLCSTRDLRSNNSSSKL